MSNLQVKLTQNNKFARDQLDFLHADQHQKFQHFGHQSLLQGDMTIINGHDQAFSKYLRFIQAMLMSS